MRVCWSGVVLWADPTRITRRLPRLPSFFALSTTISLYVFPSGQCDDCGFRNFSLEETGSIAEDGGQRCVRDLSNCEEPNSRAAFNECQ